MISWEVQGDGPTLVLLHGVGLDRRLWAPSLPALSRAHRVLLVDLPGHGRSPAIVPSTALPKLANTVSEVMDGPAHLVGFSLGALVATELAIDRPDLVQTLTLVSSVANRSEAQRASVRERLVRATTDFEGSAEQALQRWFAPDFAARAPDLMAEVRETLLATDRSSYLAAYEVFAEADATLWPRLGQIRAPTLAITGGEDPGSTPAMSRMLAEQIPHAKAVIVPGARHLLPLERPDELTELILTHTRSDHVSHRPEALQPLRRG